MNLAISTPDEILSAITKPKLSALERLALESDDWLILCAGFEDRALAAIEGATASGTAFNVLLVQYEPVMAENRISTIEELCSRSHSRSRI